MQVLSRRVVLPPGSQAMDSSDAGALPADWAGLRRLQQASLQYNEGLSGQIPGEWGEKSSGIRKAKFLVLKPGTVRVHGGVCYKARCHTVLVM